MTNRHARLRSPWRLLAVAALLAGAGCSAGLKAPPAKETIEIAGERFTLEVAADTASRTRGLMGRTGIPADGGMLFIFPRAAVQSFWMADCLVDIDIIFLDGVGRVTATHRMKVELRREGESEIAYRSRLKGYSSVYPAQFAIELRAGTIDRLGIRVEDKIALDVERLKALAR